MAQTLNGAARVPVLPGKRLLGQLSVEVVLERRRQLQGYGFRVLGVGAVRSLSHHTHSRPRPHAHTPTQPHKQVSRPHHGQRGAGALGSRARLPAGALVHVVVQQPAIQHI